MALRSGLLTGSLILLAAACRPDGRAAIEWTGSDTGRATLAAHAERCGTAWRLFAMSGDTGIAIVLYPNGKVLEPGAMPVLAPAEARETRPAAAFAARWTDSLVVSGYRGVEGTVAVRRSDPGLTGSFRALTRRDGDLREVTVRGDFRDVPIAACSDSGG